MLLFDQGPPFGRKEELRLSVSRSVARSRVVEGESVLVELSLTNEGEDVERVMLRDEVPEGVEVARGSTRLLSSLGRGETATLRYEATFSDPGEARFGRCVVMAQSLFALSERRFDLFAPAIVKVYPRLLVRNVPPVRAKAVSFAGSSPSRYKGGRLEFMDIREHTYGDPIRHVNWKASARSGKKLVNEWHAERGLDCVMIVNLLQGDVPRAGTWSARTDLITSAYELAHALIGQGNRLGLLVLGDAAIRLQPGFGSRQLKALLELLVMAREGSVWNGRHVEGFLQKFFRKQYRYQGGALFFVTATPSANVLEAVTNLATKGFVCNTIVVNTLEPEAEALVEMGVAGGASLAIGKELAAAEDGWFKTRFKRYSEVFEWTREGGFSKLGGRKD